MIKAPDLRTEVPRSPFEELEGLAWLPRMIDKARAYYAGTHGDYSPYPCPGDKRFLKHFGLKAEALGQLIRSGASDEEIGRYAKEHARGGEENARAFREWMRTPSNPVISLALAYFRRKRQGIMEQRFPGVPLARIDTFSKMLALEEGHAVPGL